MGENSLEFENIFDPGIATWLAEDLGTQALVLGKLERDAGNAKLSVTSYSVRDGRGTIGFEITLRSQMSEGANPRYRRERGCRQARVS